MPCGRALTDVNTDKRGENASTHSTSSEAGMSREFSSGSCCGKRLDMAPEKRRKYRQKRARTSAVSSRRGRREETWQRTRVALNGDAHHRARIHPGSDVITRTRRLCMFALASVSTSLHPGAWAVALMISSLAPTPRFPLSILNTVNPDDATCPHLRTSDKSKQ
jgi:hypothetical protein